MTHQPRYLAYCRDTGLSPEETQARDRERYPGGSGAGFLIWSGQRIAEWREFSGNAGPLDHDAYDSWLQARYPEARG